MVRQSEQRSTVPLSHWYAESDRSIPKKGIGVYGRVERKMMRVAKNSHRKTAKSRVEPICGKERNGELETGKTKKHHT